ncbi:fimbrial protein [Metapseudomonas otitidis]|uniref:fimbrial protein n=1 Tax=Metapseudomonas otitidis TaxID=319939 RepID=UPI0040554C58
MFDTQGWIMGGWVDVTCGGFLQHGNMYLRYGYLSGASVPGFPNVYPTGIPGVGIRVAWSRVFGTVPPEMSGGQWIGSPRKVENLPPGRYTPTSNWWIQLIKTGSISTGTYKIPEVQVHYQDELTNALKFREIELVSRARGCSLQTKDQIVSLGKSWPKDFRGMGSTARPKDFDIKLDCEPSVRITYRIDGIRVDGSTLINTGMGNTESKPLADGVGIQLLLRHGAGGPLPMGSEITLGNSAASGPSSLQIPLTAQYKQVGATITPGFVGSLATITLFYR